MIKYLLLLIYPLLLFLCWILIYKHYKSAINNNWKALLINTIAISIIIILGLYIFLSFENTIYTYDYAGHWIRSLTIKNLFINDPRKIIFLVYDSMNNMDYSYLPALFNFPFLLIKESFKWFSIVNFILFLLPAIILLQIIYFDKTKLNKHLPIILAITIYPLYLTLFYGKVDVCGLFFITMCYALVIFKDDITTQDNLSINLFAFLAVFLRRWYLYSIICFYLVYLIKIIIKKDKELLINYLLSFIPLTIIILLLFRNFLTMALINNFAESYQFYNRADKLLSFINYLSPIILLVVLCGIYQEFKTNKSLLLFNIISIVLPCILVWRIQSFEYHHYYIFLLNILILFTSGIEFINDFKSLLIIPVLLVMTIQAIFIFTYTNNIPLLTKIRKTPEVLDNKEQLMDLSSYIKTIETEGETSNYAYIVGGSYGIITDDLLRNANLPNLDSPNIDSAVLDIRDGFPRDMKYIKYVVIVEPMLYMDKDYQHMYDVISNAITSNNDVSKIYSFIKSMPINDEYSASIYEKTGEYTDEIKEYFYNQMIGYYPDKKEFFSYILN